MKKYIACMDAMEWLWWPHSEEYRMIFADPPDNIDMDYKGYKDKMCGPAYENLLYTILHQGSRCAKVVWLSVNSKHTALMGHIAYEFAKVRPNWEFKPCVQFFTFGQHNHKDFGNNHRLLYRFQLTGVSKYMDAVRVPSWRQLNGDKRADARGRVPGDVFEFPRVTGNSKQRRAFSPTQLHEDLYVRCIQSSCARGDTVVDLFAGSGTLGRVATRCGVNAVMIEKSKQTYRDILKDQPECVEVEW